ncbi:unnamed protein product [Cunninghamella echinulata]
MSQALPTYRIPSIEERSQEKCEEYETLVYNVESCRLSCQIMFNIGTMVFYEDPRYLKTKKPNGTFCTSVQFSPSFSFSTSSSSTITSEKTNSLHGTCQSGTCQPNNINNKNNHNEDGSHNNNPGNNVDQNNKNKNHSPSKTTSCFTRTKSHTVNVSSTPK